MTIRALFATACFLIAGVSAVSATVRPLAGPVILARSGTQALYLWDASPYVAQLVAEKNVGTGALQTLEATAINILLDKAKSSRAKFLTLRVVYTRSGAVSPVYGTLTFNGVEKLATLTASREVILKRGAGWAASAAAGKLPRDIKIKVTGKLPPQ